MAKKSKRKSKQRKASQPQTASKKKIRFLREQVLDHVDSLYNMYGVDDYDSEEVVERMLNTYDDYLGAIFGVYQMEHSETKTPGKKQDRESFIYQIEDYLAQAD